MAGKTNFYPGASLFIPDAHPLRDSLHSSLEEMYQEHLCADDARSWTHDDLISAANASEAADAAGMSRSNRRHPIHLTGV